MRARHRGATAGQICGQDVAGVAIAAFLLKVRSRKRKARRVRPCESACVVEVAAKRHADKRLALLDGIE